MESNVAVESRSAPTSAPRAAAEAPLSIALLGYRGNPYSGGQGIYLKYVSSALADLGHRVDVIAGEPYPDLDPRVRLIRLPGLDLFSHYPHHARALRLRHLRSATDTFEYLSMLTGGFSEPYTFGRRLVRYMARHGHRYDVVHDNQSLSYGVGTLARRGKPLIATIHHPITWDRDIALGHAEDWRARLLIRRWYAFLDMQIRVSRRLDHLVTVSERSRADIAAAFGIPAERIAVVPNGIDADVFRPLPHIARDPRRIITTASADQPLKGMRHLLNAFRELGRADPDLSLTVIGKPEPGGATERQIAALGLGDRITFRHGIDTAELVELYARSAVAVVPSEYEGFGLPAGEAMAAGVPVVSTDGGALPEVVGDAGVIVPAGNALALARAIRALLAEPARRHALATAGRVRIRERFGWHRAAAMLTGLYRRARGE